MCATGLFTYICTKNNISTCKNYHQIHKTWPSSQCCSYHSANVSESESASCLHAAMLFVRKKFTSRWSGEGGVDVVKDKCSVWGERKKRLTFAKCFSEVMIILKKQKKGKAQVEIIVLNIICPETLTVLQVKYKKIIIILIILDCKWKHPAWMIT